MELALTPPIQPRPAGHQEQSQEQLSEQRKRRNAGGTAHGDNHRVLFADGGSVGIRDRYRCRLLLTVAQRLVAVGTDMQPRIGAFAK